MRGACIHGTGEERVVGPYLSGHDEHIHDVVGEAGVLESPVGGHAEERALGLLPRVRVDERDLHAGLREGLRDGAGSGRLAEPARAAKRECDSSGHAVRLCARRRGNPAGGPRFSRSAPSGDVKVGLWWIGCLSCRLLFSFAGCIWLSFLFGCICFLFWCFCLGYSRLVVCGSALGWFWFRSFGFSRLVFFGSRFF